MSNKTKSPVSFWIPLLLSWVFVGLLWWFAPCIVSTQLTASTSGDSTGMTAGTFGDQFGFINALFSGLALATIAISLWYQRHDIQIQQQALIDQKVVFERQLRLAATTEIVASLPNFRFSCSDSATGFKIEIRNTGAEVYNLTTHLITHLGWKLKIVGTDGYYGSKPLQIFEVSPYTDNSLIETVSVRISLNFTLRSGEPVTEPYYFDHKLKQMERARPLKDTIEELLTRLNISTPPPKAHNEPRQAA